MSSQVNSTLLREPSWLPSNLGLYRMTVTPPSGGRTSIQRAAGVVPHGRVLHEGESHRLDPEPLCRVLVADVEADLVYRGQHLYSSRVVWTHSTGR